MCLGGGVRGRSCVAESRCPGWLLACARQLDDEGGPFARSIAQCGDGATMLQVKGVGADGDGMRLFFVFAHGLCRMRLSDLTGANCFSTWECLSRIQHGLRIRPRAAHPAGLAAGIE